ncbi:MAG TPA: hypothetical protein VK698_01965 [Kofleriaceae bacterium]|nr:hypothetical protein [Kofleriaceae bacterium]
MSKSIRQASVIIVVALLLVAGYRLSSTASADPGPAKVTSTQAPTAAPTADAEAPDVLVPQATCSAIKCPTGQTCIDTLQCTPEGGCFHVGRCVSFP